MATNVDAVQISLARRRLEFALLRSGRECDGESLHALVVQVARIVESHPVQPDEGSGDDDGE